MKKYILFLLMSFSLPSFANSFTSSRMLSEDRFHDLFIISGYSTAFGAALGAAVLGLSPNPGEKLRYVAMGASLGFIAGSVMGSYVIFAPVFTVEDTHKAVSPAYAQHDSNLRSAKYTLWSNWTLTTF